MLKLLIRLGVWLAVVTASLSNGGCSALSWDDGPFEKVTAISLDPANPAPGDTVRADADWTSNLSYPAMAGSGPKFNWSVSGGEMTGLVYDDTLGDYVELSGQQLTTDQAVVHWTLPQSAGPVWIKAELLDGGSKLNLMLGP